MDNYGQVNGKTLRVCKVIKPLPNKRTYLVALGEFDYDPRGHSVLVEFDDGSQLEAAVVAMTGNRAGIVVTY